MKIKITLASLLLASTSYAADFKSLLLGKLPPPPPPSAIAACDNSEADDTCQFNYSQTVIHGVCFTPDEKFPLACKPNKEDMQYLPCAGK